MGLVDHVLDHMLDHLLDHIIIGLMIMALQWVYASHFTTTYLEMHWSANNFLSLGSSISAWFAIVYWDI